MPIDIPMSSESPIAPAAAVLFIGVLQSSAKPGTLPPALKAVDTALGGALAKLAAKGEFAAKRDQVMTISSLGRLAADKVVVMGLGERRAVHTPDVRIFAAKAARAANGDKAESLALVLPAGLEG